MTEAEATIQTFLSAPQPNRVIIQIPPGNLSATEDGESCAPLPTAAPEFPGAPVRLPPLALFACCGWLLLPAVMLSRFLSSWVSQCLVDLSSFRHSANVSSFSWSGRHWQSASQALFDF